MYTKSASFFKKERKTAPPKDILMNHISKIIIIGLQTLSIRSHKHIVLSRDMQQLVMVQLKVEMWNSQVSTTPLSENEWFLPFSLLQNV